jgi:sugar phosphate isomerase/epimerase
MESMKPKSRPEVPPTTSRKSSRIALLAASGTPLAAKAAAQDSGATPRPIIGFSKPFQSLSADDMASLVEEIGWNGIESPVRSAGQVEPERVEEDLPRLVEAFRRRGLVIPVIVTEIFSMRQPHAEIVLRTAAKLGIKRIRLGIFKYVQERPLEQQLNEFGKTLKEIGDACGELGIQAAVQNHSGFDRFGAPVWDLYTVLRDFQIKNVGMCFDIAHAMVEGGLSWPIQARLMEPYYAAVYVKDFTWARGANGWGSRGASGWGVTWRPLGEGMVDRSFIAGLPKSGFSGPICQHHEYPLGDRAEMLALMQRDLRVLKDWLG